MELTLKSTPSICRTQWQCLDYDVDCSLALVHVNFHCICLYAWCILLLGRSTESIVLTEIAVKRWAGDLNGQQFELFNKDDVGISSRDSFQLISVSNLRGDQVFNKLVTWHRQKAVYWLLLNKIQRISAVTDVKYGIKSTGQNKSWLGISSPVSRMSRSLPICLVN